MVVGCTLESSVVVEKAYSHTQAVECSADVGQATLVGYSSENIVQDSGVLFAGLVSSVSPGLDTGSLDYSLSDCHDEPYSG